MPYLYLILSIITEVIGVLFKNNRWLFKTLSNNSNIYFICRLFLFLSKTLQHLPLNITYASWGLGLILTTLVSIIIFKENVNLMSILSIAFILVGVISLNIFGSSH